MTTREIKKSFHDAIIDSVEGSGNELTLKLRAFRKTKAGTYERHELTVKFGRWHVKRLLKQLKDMHARDRDRIQGELDRITHEANVLRGES